MFPAAIRGLSPLCLGTSLDQRAAFYSLFSPTVKVMTYSRMELILRVHPLYVECCVHFIPRIPHEDFVKKIVRSVAYSGGLETQGSWGTGSDPAANRQHGMHLV